MTTMLIAGNMTRESGSFCGDQLCSLKTCYLFVQNTPNIDRVIMSMSPSNEMAHLWDRFLDDPKGDGSIPPVEVIYDSFNAGDWRERWNAWDRWRAERKIEGRVFGAYRELYLRIHGAQRQTALCGSERGLGRRNIFVYWVAGQENMPDDCPGSDVYDVEINHPPLTSERDIYIAPHAKTQGNHVFTFDFWSQVVRKLIDAGLTVTVGYNGHFCEDLNNHPLYRKFYGTHKEWMHEVCKHRIVACGNTGAGWLAAACGVPLFTMEPPNSVMADHRYRECGLRNIVEMMREPDADYCARRLIEEIQRVIVVTTGCYDVLHAGHIRHLERSRALGSKLIVALNSDASIRTLKGETRPINSQEQRKSVLEALRCVDEVRITDDPTEVVRSVKPNVLTNGYGYTLDKVVGRDFIESYGGRVVITCKGDARDEPSTTKIVRRMQNAEIMEVCVLGLAHSVNPLAKLKLLADQYLSVADVQGDIADLGTYKGGTALILRRLAPDKHLHMFDTWHGTPIDDPLCHHKKGEWAADLEECKKIVGNSELTHYHQGVFPQWDGDDCHDENYRPARENFFSFVYIDMDTYSATSDAIDVFWPLLAVGGKMMLDDYSWIPCSGVQKAVDESFLQDQLQIFPELHSCVVRKP